MGAEAGDDKEDDDGRWCEVVAGCDVSTFPKKDIVKVGDASFCRYKYTVMANGKTHDPDVLIEDGVVPPRIEVQKKDGDKTPRKE